MDKLRIQQLALWIAFAFIATATQSATARTIELQAEALDRAAVISADAPLAGWAGYQDRANSYKSTEALLKPGAALLIRYDLSKIPEDMRVTKAEWFVPVHEHEPSETRLYIWPMLTSWGAGVCYNYRAQVPEQEAWDEPGGRSPGIDRSVEPSQVLHVTEDDTAVVVNVTQDVSLWHRGLVPNEGWMLTVEDRRSWVRLGSPLRPVESDWVLRITYEPK